jgi:hypothetical protein
MLSLQCFVWLGNGIVGGTTEGSAGIKPNDTALFSTLSSAVRRVATGTFINRQQLLRIASIYENTLTLSPVDTKGVQCIGDRIEIDPKSVEIVGDNRHLQEYVPGPLPPN